METQLSHFAVENNDGSIRISLASDAMGMMDLDNEVMDWAKDQYAKSFYWIAPNISRIIHQMQARFESGLDVFTMTIEVPFMSYDGPTGETEMIHIVPVMSVIAL